MSTPRLRRLLLVTSDYHYRNREGGVCTTSAFMRFVPELLALAERIDVCAPVHASGEERGYGIEGRKVAYRPLPPSRTLEQFLRRLPKDGLPIARILYAGIRKADLVWINGPHPLLPLAALLCRLVGKPYLLWLRGDILATVSAKYRSGTGRDRLAARTAYYLDRTIAWAARNAAVFYTGGGLKRYAERARYAQPAQASLVREADLAPSPRTTLHTPVRLLWAGQLRPVKGLVHLLRAARLLQGEGRDVRLTLVGGGEQEEELRALVAALGLERSVRFAGYVPPGSALCAYFDEADVFVLPSISEGVPKVLLEAMARALPVVASRVGGVPDVIRDGENGVLVPPADPAALAVAVARVLDDPGLRGRLSAGALAFAREHTARAEADRIQRGVRQAFPNLWGDQ